MKLVLRYGAIVGLTISLCLFVSFEIVKTLNIPLDKSRAIAGLFSIIILILGIYLGIKNTKKDNGGILLYKNAVFTGVKISLLVALIVSLYSFLYCTVINPNFGEFMAREAERSLTLSGNSQQEITSKLGAVRQEYSTGIQVFQSFIGQAVIGSIASIIIGLFLKTKSTNS